MATLKLTGVPPLDGDYDLDVQSFTNRELHTIKELAGVRAGELQKAMEAGDNDLIVAFAVILIRRTGRTVDPDLIWDADMGAITVILDDAPEVAERPLPSPPASGSASSSGDDGKPAAPATSSGPTMNGSGDQHPAVPSPTGLPGSETPLTSAPGTSPI